MATPEDKTPPEPARTPFDELHPREHARYNAQRFAAHSRTRGMRAKVDFPHTPLHGKRVNVVGVEPEGAFVHKTGISGLFDRKVTRLPHNTVIPEENMPRITEAPEGGLTPPEPFRIQSGRWSTYNRHNHEHDEDGWSLARGYTAAGAKSVADNAKRRASGESEFGVKHPWTSKKMTGGEASKHNNKFFKAYSPGNAGASYANAVAAAKAWRPTHESVGEVITALEEAAGDYAYHAHSNNNDDHLFDPDLYDKVGSYKHPKGRGDMPLYREKTEPHRSHVLVGEVGGKTHHHYFGPTDKVHDVITGARQDELKKRLAGWSEEVDMDESGARTKAALEIVTAVLEGRTSDFEVLITEELDRRASMIVEEDASYDLAEELQAELFDPNLLINEED